MIAGAPLLAALASALALPVDDGTTVLHVGKVLTMNDADDVVAPGMLVLEGGKIAYAGPIVERPDLPEPVVDAAAWAAPGFVDLHTHIHGGGFGDINDMVRAVNPELRAAPAYRPNNPLIQVGRAGGVTTLFGIPGSGTNMGGFGIVYKSRATGGFPASVVRDPGGLKVAQDSNPQGRNATDFGVSRAGMEWNLRDVNQRAAAMRDQGRRDVTLENLAKVLARELPVLIHTAGSEGVVNAARMWKVKHGATAVVSHGSFDGWKSAQALAEAGIPVNHGPRTIDYFSSREGRIVGSGAEFVAAGVQLFSLNTDSSVIPQETFFLQGSMSARYGADPYLMLRALTIHPAQSFDLADRVGSLEVGKDADVVLWDGDPLDPRSAVRCVYIDGDLEYDRERDGQLF
ncbi:MAG: amidohydrolase family protein [Planctomycetota bacterium]